MSETTTWWKVNWWNDEIEPVEVLKETDKMLTIRTAGGGERRVTKAGETSYYPTEAEAVGWLIERALARVRDARRQLEVANAKLGNLKGKYRDHPAFGGEKP